ncbi:MAG: ATP cone domain-containing protein, partial [Cetobacterium sp.]
MRQVINRAGIRENLDITKIREKLTRASEGLEVNMVELESHIESIYEENITTKKIQQSLINEAVSMTSFEESDWTYVAGRLLMMETEREVFHKRGFSYGELFKTVKTLTGLGIYDDRLLKYSEEEVKELEAVIDISRDM